jgi:hypothetical protein
MEALKQSKSDAANAVITDETVFDGQTEQGVELDYVLPDYYPEIFKILKCTLTPHIVSYSVSADSKLILDGTAVIRVMYLAENSNAVHCIEQRYTYSRTVDMSRKGSAAAISDENVTLSQKADYCNCRAISGRRIDVRGAISCKIRAVCPAKYEFAKLPDNVQVRTKEITCCGETLTAEKRSNIREEIETGASGIGFILQSEAVPKITDLRVIADKAVVKGVITLNALYGVYDPENSGCTEMEQMSADVPVSFILDIDGVTDSHLCIPEISVMSFELSPKTDSGIISCDMSVMCRVRAQAEKTAVIPIDMYSTEYESDFTAAEIRIAANPRVVAQQTALRSTLSCDSGEIRSVWSCRSEIGNLTCRPTSDGELTLSGQICYQVIGKTVDGVPFFAEKQEAFEQKIPAADVSGDTAVDFRTIVSDTGFSIKSDGTLDLTARIDFSGNLRNISRIDAINSAIVHEDKPKDKSDDYALTIFYSNGGEDCWSIAKKYNTTVEAVMRENDIENEQSPLSGMILIPTV